MNNKPSGSASSKRQQMRQERQQKEQRKRLLVVAGIAIAALVVAAIIIIPNMVPTEIKEITPVARPMVNGRELGQASAPVVVEVFEDFQCPACKSYSESVEPVIVDTFVADGRVRYIFRHMPFLDDRAPRNESDQSANASMCAADQGRFWDYHDIVFANWDGENQGAYNDKNLVAFAESLGLDMTAFNVCFDKNTFKADIDADLQLSQQYGVDATPTVFVNGVKVENLSASGLQQAIEQALATGS